MLHIVSGLGVACGKEIRCSSLYLVTGSEEDKQLTEKKQTHTE